MRQIRHFGHTQPACGKQPKHGPDPTAQPSAPHLPPAGHTPATNRKQRRASLPPLLYITSAQLRKPLCVWSARLTRGERGGDTHARGEGGERREAPGRKGIRRVEASCSPSCVQSLPSQSHMSRSLSCLCPLWHFYASAGILCWVACQPDPSPRRALYCCWVWGEGGCGLPSQHCASVSSEGRGCWYSLQPCPHPCVVESSFERKPHRRNLLLSALSPASVSCCVSAARDLLLSTASKKEISDSYTCLFSLQCSCLS